MDRSSNAYTVLFATVVCVTLAICLAATYNGLKAGIDANAEFDRHKNVLIAMGLVDRVEADKSKAEIARLFEERVVGDVLKVVRGPIPTRAKVDGKPTEVEVRGVLSVEKTDHAVAEIPDLNKREAAKPEEQRVEYVPLYRSVDESGETQAYAIPISGYGLWSWLYGYLALEADLDTVRGITFYKHGETPGLGGEVDNPAWQQEWQGKQILNDRGELVGVTVKKGTVDVAIPNEKDHMVDGLSGATITSNAVTRFLLDNLQTYERYFKKLRNGH